jgi:hypothetical protein
MRNIFRLLVLLFSLQAISAFSQVPVQTIRGNRKFWHFRADSLNHKDKIQDSVTEKIRKARDKHFAINSDGTIIVDGDTLPWVKPETLHGKTFEFPEFPKFPKFVQPFEESPNKKSTPIPGYDGWFYKELSEL